MKERLLQCLALLQAFEDQELEVSSNLSFGLSFRGDGDDIETMDPDSIEAVSLGLNPRCGGWHMAECTYSNPVALHRHRFVVGSTGIRLRRRRAAFKPSRQWTTWP
jgi:hypothetical protein